MYFLSHLLLVIFSASFVFSDDTSIISGLDIHQIQSSLETLKKPYIPPSQPMNVPWADNKALKKEAQGKPEEPKSLEKSVLDKPEEPKSLEKLVLDQPEEHKSPEESVPSYDEQWSRYIFDNTIQIHDSDLDLNPILNDEQYEEYVLVHFRKDSPLPFSHKDFEEFQKKCQNTELIKALTDYLSTSENLLEFNRKLDNLYLDREMKNVREVDFEHIPKYSQSNSFLRRCTPDFAYQFAVLASFSYKMTVNIPLNSILADFIADFLEAEMNPPPELENTPDSDLPPSYNQLYPSKSKAWEDLNIILKSFGHYNVVKILRRNFNQFSGIILQDSTNASNLVLSFCGTKPTTLDVLGDLFFVSTKMDDDVYCHYGFLFYFNQALEDIKEVLNNLDPNISYTFTITGHSLGAALSEVAAYWIKKNYPRINVQVINFASPRPFSRGTKRYVEKILRPENIVKFVSHYDYVPSCPPEFIGHYSLLTLFTSKVPPITFSPMEPHAMSNYRIIVEQEYPSFFSGMINYFRTLDLETNFNENRRLIAKTMTLLEEKQNSIYQILRRDQSLEQFLKDMRTETLKEIENFNFLLKIYSGVKNSELNEHNKELALDSIKSCQSIMNVLDYLDIE